MTQNPHAQRTIVNFQLKTLPLVIAIIKNEDKNVAHLSFFNHILTFRNKNGFTEEKQNVSAYLNFEYTSDQQKLLNPPVLDNVTEYMMNDSLGKGTKKRLPQRRLNFIDDMVSSYYSVLNSKERLTLIHQAREVSAVMVDLEQERHEKIEDKRRKKAENLTSIKERRKSKEANEREAKIIALLKCRNTMKQLDVIGVCIFDDEI